MAMLLSVLALSGTGAQAAAGGPLVLMGIDAEDGGPGGHGSITVYRNVVANIYAEATPPAPANGILVIGGGKNVNDSVTTFWNAIAAGTGIPVSYVSGATNITNVSFTPVRMLAVVSDRFNTPSGGLTESENNALTGRDTDIANFVNADGGLLGFTSDWGGSGSTPYGYLGDVGAFGVSTGVPQYQNVEATPAGEAIGISDSNLDVCCWHDYYNTFPSFLEVLANDASNGRIAAIGGLNVQVPTGISLDPPTATNPAGTSHTVTASVEDQNGDPLPGVEVSFEVISGENIGQQSPPGCTADPACVTDANGQVSWTYTSNGNAGQDTIQACFNDASGQPRCGTAEKTWERSDPDTVVLTPPTATNTAGDEHCVTATVTAGGSAADDVSVVFSVAGANTASGSDTTDVNGHAEFCYTGTTAGDDTITAFADTNGNGTQDPGEPSGTATKTYVAAEPASVVLTPPTATNTVGDQHCVTATVTDEFGNPVAGVTVGFTVTGPGSSAGSATTDANGQATYCYTSAFPGADTITAFADNDGDSTQDPDEPSGTASKTWVVPAAGADCKVTNGGHIVAANGDSANFGGNAQAKSNAVKGQQQYTDHGPATPMNVHSITVQSVVCRPDATASIFGTATINGAGSYSFRIDVKDAGEPGTSDTYRMRLSNGYDSGDQILVGGNIQIHKG